MNQPIISDPYFENFFIESCTENSNNKQILKTEFINTPIGSMIAIANDQSLYLLEFVDCRSLKREIRRLLKETNSKLILGKSTQFISIEKELNLYFLGQLKTFSTPFYLVGTPFQKNVWKELTKIPFAKTCSYEEIAKTIDNPKGFRAVARANGANQFAILIPCHRVINKSGLLGGYDGGIERKKWLLEHEKNFVSNNE
ncbi:MAG: methylated-DNA--[protein]-cysteine S-methyltransferase [Parachlamydiaceae bacterium]|nr:methylated-DNA--[protein]-cysteine S-methyltransferase [Parachlamydiaceae bacterium]